MSAPEHSSEHPPGFLPLGDLAALRSAATWRLLIPSDTRSALAAARQDNEPKEEIPGFSVEEPSTVASAAHAPAPRRAKPGHVLIFGPEALTLANVNLRGADRYQRDPDAVPPPLLSRVEVFDIPAPEPEQRLQLILAEVRRLQRATGKRIELDASAAEALSERSDVDLRATHRLVQDAFATAMASGKAFAVLKVPRRAARLTIGFVADGQSGERA